MSQGIPVLEVHEVCDQQETGGTHFIAYLLEIALESIVFRGPMFFFFNRIARVLPHDRGVVAQPL